MVDFLMISTRSRKNGVIEIYPKFIIKKSSDLMIRGGDFYAIWLEDRNMWSTDEQDALQLIDKELDAYLDENAARFNGNAVVMHMWDAESGMIDAWHKYCQKQTRDYYHMLDEKLIFSNDKVTKTDYASKMLNYPLAECDISSYEKIISTLYTKEERHKIEWAIGSIVSGDSKFIQKFMVLYGSAGTGKSTILNIIQKLFDGYHSVFDAKALGSSSNSFALEAFKTNPLVAIQHDGDLSKIEDNTRLNSLVSHETMVINEKFKSAYSNHFKCFLFMGTNKPVKITDAKSGLIRRLIDVSPSGNKLTVKEYNTAMSRIDFELGGIAKHCLDVYLDDPEYYNSYIPISMMGASNDFYNFIFDNYSIFDKENGTTLKSVWELYKNYAEETKMPFQCSQRVFKEELKNYFDEYKERFTLDDGTRVRSYYHGFKRSIFEENITVVNKKEDTKDNGLIKFDSISSIFDSAMQEYPAQYASNTETPKMKWESVKTTLADIDTSKLHYVRVPENHIVIDFDIPDESGNKSLEINLREASKWPPTYAELSKSGCGIHLHYNYVGDVTKLSRVYDDKIEVKIFNGNSSLRRKLSKCNNLPISDIASGLPLKGADKMVDFKAVSNEKALRTLIKRNLNKEIHPGTKPSVDFINKILKDAYDSGLKYDVTDMRNAIIGFAAKSTHQADLCLKITKDMKFKSDDISESVNNDSEKLVFYDVEVFPNLFLVNWKLEGPEHKVVRMINPTPAQIEELLHYRLVGFNCRRYDNHIMYARLMGYTNEQLYNLSQKIVQGSPNCMFGEAYNLSYTDVYDFSNVKQSLKKFEIELGIHHQELGLPWDEPVDESLWEKVAEYCDNDVIATEAVFNARQEDFIAREVLAKVAGMTVNDTTNSLTGRIIFGREKHPHSQFNYRDLGKPVRPDDPTMNNRRHCDYRIFDRNGEPIYDTWLPFCDMDPLPDGYSIMPFFPGYKFENGKSYYRGEEVGEGGYVDSTPGMYEHVALLDIASMHPTSAIEEDVFGPEYTKNYEEIKLARIAIKHKDYDAAKEYLKGALAEFLEEGSKISTKSLAFALKIPINAVYGLTSAKFDNLCKDPRNIDNIVAKRGALFMINLKHKVREMGYEVAHIKTDSIKIPNATPEIIEFVMNYGKEFGYVFEHEATYEKMCLVNDAVYIAKYSKDEFNEHPGEWTATGAQFAVPYVYKKLFTREPITIEDMCETKSVSTSMYLDFDENLPEGEHDYRFIGKVGQFCPVVQGVGGGVLVAERKDADGNIKYASVTGAKGYLWKESEVLRANDAMDQIDYSFYNTLVDKAAESISKYGDLEWFISDDNN